MTLACLMIFRMNNNLKIVLHLNKICMYTILVEYVNLMIVNFLKQRIMLVHLRGIRLKTSFLTTYKMIFQTHKGKYGTIIMPTMKMSTMKTTTTTRLKI